MKLILTQVALEDLRSIRNYTLEHWGEEQESRYLDALWARFEVICVIPERHKLRNDLFPNCRIATEGKHVILFRVEGQTLEVVRVLHGAMDFKRHLSADE